MGGLKVLPNLTMNPFITYCAQAKLLDLIKRVSSGAILIENLDNQLTLDFSTDSEITFRHPQSIIVNMMPRVYSTLSAAPLLKEASIDFDYNSQHFIISVGH